MIMISPLALGTMYVMSCNFWFWYGMGVANSMMKGEYKL